MGGINGLNQSERNRTNQCPRFLIAIAAFVGVLATCFAVGQPSAETVRWAAGNGYPPGPVFQSGCGMRRGVKRS